MNRILIAASLLLFSAGCAWGSPPGPDESVQDQPAYNATNQEPEPAAPWAALPPATPSVNPPQDPINPPGTIQVPPKNSNERQLFPRCNPNELDSCH